MAGKVFISCGQRPPVEKKAAEAVAKLLKDDFGLTPYLSFKIQSLEDIMTITRELRSSDYFIFIDFLRHTKKTHDLPCSIFSHQELALAHHLGFKDMIALQQKGVPFEGFLKYVLSNPEQFVDEKDLIKRVKRLVEERGWSASYSRNLIVEELGFTPLLQYRDHTGTYLERVWQVRIENKRPDTAAIGAVCILDFIKTADGNEIPSPDRSYLKWAGQSGYERTILPLDFGNIDLFSIHADKAGLFLHSSWDAPRDPIIKEDGDYQLFFKLFSQGFPLVEFAVKIELRWSRPSPSDWNFKSTASLV